MKTVLRRTAILLACVLTACGGAKDATGPTSSASISGTYTLTILGGVVPPAGITYGGVPVAVHGSTLVITTANAYSRTAVVETSAGTSTITDQGTVAIHGSNITLTSSDDGSAISGTWGTDVVTVTDSGYLWTYAK